jgi:hypothetical protein
VPQELETVDAAIPKVIQAQVAQSRAYGRQDVNVCTGLGDELAPYQAWAAERLNFCTMLVCENRCCLASGVSQCGCCDCLPCPIPLQLQNALLVLLLACHSLV